MRLFKTLLATVAVLALTGSAFAKNTHDERTVHMGGTTHIAAGGTLRMQIARKPKGRPPWRIYEVPISYSGRTYEEGKKIGLKDAFQALYCIVRYWIKD